MTKIMTPSVVIVEDSLVEIMNIQNILAEADIQLLGTAINAEQLFALIEKESPDLILMDINLGSHESGIDIAKLVAEQFAIPIVFTTSYCDDTTISSALKVSPYGYLVKPYGALSLTTTILVALERKRIEHELASSNRRFAMASEMAKLGVLEIDSASRSIVIESVDNLFDFPRKLTVEKFLSLFTDEQRLEVAEAIRLKTNYVTTLQLKIAGRETRWYQVVLSDVVWKKDYVQIGAIQDISILQHAQSNLTIADRVVSEIKEGVLVCDANGSIVKVNKALCEILGCEPGELISQYINKIFPKERKHDPRPDYLIDGLRTDLTIVNEGRRYHLVMSVTSFDNGSGETHFVAILTDVSDITK